MTGADRPLEDRTFLVAGGAGEVGEGLVRRFLARGARVVVPSRSDARLRDLRERLAADEALLTFGADVGDEGSAAALRDRLVDEVGPLDGVVASLGGWWQGAPLTEVPLHLWNRLLQDGLTAHFVLARTFLPVLAGRLGSSYTLINGGGGLRPVPNAGPVSVSAAGQLMLARALAAEHARAAVRVNALVLATPVLTRSRPHGPEGWLTADDAGEYAARLASLEGEGTRGHIVVLRDRRDLPPLPTGEA